MDLSLYGFSGLNELYNVHPAFVHFPIALIPTSLAFFILGLYFRRDWLIRSSYLLIFLSFLSALITVLTGLQAQETLPHNERVHHMMVTHRTTGLLILGLVSLLVLLNLFRDEFRLKPRFLRTFTAVLIFSTYLVLQNGDLGSRMVYLEGAAVKPALPEANQTEHVRGEQGHEHRE